MSRRSIFLASTVALSSLMGMDHAFAMNLGGLGGGPIGHAMTFNRPAVVSTMRAAPSQPIANLGRAPSIAARAAESNIASIHLQPSRVPAGASAGAEGPFVHPQKPAQTGTSSGSERRPFGDGTVTNTTAPNGLTAAAILAAHLAAARPNVADVPAVAGNAEPRITRPEQPRRPVDGGSLAATDNANGPSEAVIIAAHNTVEGRGKLLKAGSDDNAPKLGDKPVFGVAANNNGKHVDVGDITDPNGPEVNLPGTPQRQKGPGTVPGFGDAGKGTTVNLPGATDRHGPDEATKIVSEKSEQDQQLLQQAAQGGFTNLNVPTRSSDGTDVSRDSGNQNQNPIAFKAPDDANYNVVVKEDENGNFSGVFKPDANGSRVYQYVVPDPQKPDHSYDGVTGAANTAVATVAGGPVAGAVAAIVSIWTSITNYNYSKEPDETDSGTTTSTAGGLASNSPASKTQNGGGTGNNETQASGAVTGQFAVGSAYARKGYGDGTGDDGGDNNHHSKDGTLAAGSAMARKDQGDGGGSDTRGGGGTSPVVGSLKIGSGGSDPRQNNLKTEPGMTH